MPSTQDCANLQLYPGSCDRGEECVLRTVHARLRDAHRHWHDALNRYADLDGMRTYVNSAIQDLRNVTFALQAAKRSIPDFDEWYGAWQANFRADLVMRWAVDTRNRVVKDSDFESHSRAHVALLGSIDGVPMMAVDADPTVSNRDLAALLMRQIQLTESLTRSGVIRVERQWIDKQMPRIEILDTLTYVFGRLSQLVAECHAHLGDKVDSTWRVIQRSPWTPDDQTPQTLLLPPCMVGFDDVRTEWIRASNGEPIEVSMRREHADPHWTQLATERYCDLRIDDIRARLKSHDLSTRVRGFWEMALHMMETDGFHVPMAWLARDCELVWQGVLDFPDNAVKNVMWEELRRQVARTGADEIILVSEGWKTQFDPSVPDRRAEDATERQETLMVDALRATGEFVAIMGLVERDGEKTIVRELQGDLKYQALYLNEVRAFWGLSRLPGPKTPE